MTVVSEILDHKMSSVVLMRKKQMVQLIRELLEDSLYEMSPEALSDEYQDMKQYQA